MAEENKPNVGGWGFTSNNNQLPPKGPWIAGIQDCGNFPGWPNFSVPSSKHQRTVSIGFLNHNANANPSWFDDFMNEAPTKKSSFHRRSVSDSLAFIDHAVNPSSPVFVNGDELESGSSSGASLPCSKIRCRDFDGIDEEHLLSMFADIEPFSKQNQKSSLYQPVDQNPVEFGQNQLSISDNPSTPSDHNSISDPSVEMAQLKNENEVESESKSTEQSSSMAAITDAPSTFSNMVFAHPPLDPNIDPKRVKRILANRQSAQRSRVRKLQYIAELERSVNALQTEVSALSPQVAFLDHQRLVLNVDNSALKQRIAALAQDKIFKDAHYEALRNEIHRLRQLYQQQYLLKEQQCMQFEPEQQQQQSIAFEPEQQQEHHENLNLKTEKNKGQQILKSSSCLMGESNKNLEERTLITDGNMAYSSDYLVQSP